MTSSLFDDSWILRVAADGKARPMGVSHGNSLICLGMLDQMEFFELFIFKNNKREILKAKFAGDDTGEWKQKGICISRPPLNSSGCNNFPLSAPLRVIVLSRALVFTRNYKSIFSSRKSVAGFIVSDNIVCLADISRRIGCFDFCKSGLVNISGSLHIML